MNVRADGLDIMDKRRPAVSFLYRTLLGRLLLKVLTHPAFSERAGKFLSSHFSRRLIPSFIRRNKIDLSECESTDFASFNDCFTRRIRPELRPVDSDPAALISPCDGMLSAYRIDSGLILPIKQSDFSVADLLEDQELADRFEDGLCLVFRLRVGDYHRYVFFDSGLAHMPREIPGKLHAVSPIALRKYPVFTENSREITLIDTDNFGTAAQIEVGALVVGRIDNHPLCTADTSGIAPVKRGAEKGCFLFGGSTIIILLEKDRAELLSGELDGMSGEVEIPVRLGQRVGTAKQI